MSFSLHLGYIYYAVFLAIAALHIRPSDRLRDLPGGKHEERTTSRKAPRLDQHQSGSAGSFPSLDVQSLAGLRTEAKQQNGSLGAAPVFGSLFIPTANGQTLFLLRSNRPMATERRRSVLRASPGPLWPVLGWDRQTSLQIQAGVCDE